MTDEALYELTCAIGKSRFAGAFGRHHPDVEDLSHELYLTMLQETRKRRSIRSVAAFAQVVARHLAGDQIRAIVRARRMLPLDAYPLLAPPAETSPLERRQRQLLLRKGLALLAPLDARILILFYFEERTREEIEEALGLTYDQLRNYKSRAIGRLRRHVEKLAQPPRVRQRRAALLALCPGVNDAA
jgi:RNA polymerase sigma factor (sigma-70 family)